MSLVFLLICLSLVQACIAPAVVSDVASNPASSILDTSFPFVSSDSTPNTCNELDKCRSLVGIITSCLATIFACIWVAVHPNIPGPNQSWASRQFESCKVLVVTLLVPEWVLAWAVRQYLQAREYGQILERARVKADADAAQLASQAITNNRNTAPVKSRRRSSSSDRGSEQPGGIELEEQSALLENSPRDSTESVSEVTTGEPNNERTRLVAHQSHHILTLVKSRSLVPPTSDELGDKSKSDALSKTIAVLQTLWFVAQCIARRIGNLAITNLEIMTLAYTVITVAMYAAWWHKPLNVRCPIRVKGAPKVVKDMEPFKWTSRNIAYYVIGEQDDISRLSSEERVPTFWSSCATGVGRDIPLYADIIALTVAMIFGAVHCAAWSYVFPSLAEQQMWRVCAIAVTAIPLPMTAAFAVSNPFGVRPTYTAVFCMAVGALLYISARIMLLILSFTTLRHLSPSAYQTVQWTTWIPHI
ncbi:hypothetical protein FIBSPDRAFT_837278 [Athelia psychrophila]|uniref:TRP C-terminal domain-containing protein n=1 Tax=Athelia psychrophila TaxID=1759441 RepID=A0A166AMB3_9AGAM|nr:hypothetical protein FIBSPDRAFT_837278 [Fibularhizoctonia sp. CBS 109695]